MRSGSAARALGKALWAKYLRDEAMDAAGALTFYTFLATFPFLLFVTTIATRRLTPELTAGLLRELARVAPAPVTALVADHLRALQQVTGTGLVVFTLAGALWSSVTAVVALTAALNRAYEVPETRSYARVHGMALVSTLFLGALALAAALLTVAWPFVAKAVGPEARAALAWLRVPLAGVLVMLVLSISYRWLPAVRPRRQRIFPGAVVGVFLWLLASWGFSAYVRVAGTYELVYGTLGGVAVLLLWMWIAGQAILVGAELNQLLGRGGAGLRRGPGRRRGGVHILGEGGDTMHAAVHRGMRVVGADGRRVGRVVGIRDDGLLVRSGFLHPTDYVAPAERVADVRGQKVYLTGSADELARAPERPPFEGHRTPSRDQRGEQRRAEVERREDVRAAQRLSDDGSGSGEGPGR